MTRRLPIRYSVSTCPMLASSGFAWSHGFTQVPPQINQIVNALSHDTPHPTTKLAHPLTYDYIAISTIQQDNVNNQEQTNFDYCNIDLLLDYHTQYIRTLTSTSITGLSEIDLFSTTTNSSINGDGTFDTTRTKTLAQLILDGKYISKHGTYENSPVNKLTLSVNKGRYNLFTTKDRAERLVEYMEHLTAVIPSWLKGTTKNNGKRIAASIKPALHQTKKTNPSPDNPNCWYCQRLNQQTHSKPKHQHQRRPKTPALSPLPRKTMPRLIPPTSLQTNPSTTTSQPTQYLPTA